MSNVKQSMSQIQQLLLTMALVLILGACGGGYDGTNLQTGGAIGSGSNTGSNTTPASSAAYTAITGAPVNYTPIESSVGSTSQFVSYAISPAMTNGFSFDPATGVISGTPDEVADEVVYTVTATDDLGDITVVMVAITTRPEIEPPSITASDERRSVREGELITPVTFANAGGPAVYTISPNLGNGLDFDSETGEISGTPTAPPTGIFFYTVTATNDMGSDTARVVITVAPAAPDITASTRSLSGTIGMPINPVIITNTGGVATYTISPSIGNDLVFDSETGEIYGIPSAPTGISFYNITATNDEGATDAVMVTVTIVAALPRPDITASSNSFIVTAGSIMTPVIIRNIGGTVASYSISPAIANGLIFNRSTGEISGTPIAAAGVIRYTITATNDAGSSSTTVAITVQDAAPDINARTYSFIATAGTPITPFTITNTGGAATSCSGNLPSRLTVAASGGDCVITGTPNIVGTGTYTITARNNTSSDSTTVNISVRDTLVIPDIADSKLAMVVTEGKTIEPITITNIGGAADRYDIFPNIGNGLSFDSDTGTISGTPTAVAGTVNYVVIASNNQGTSVTTISITVQIAEPNITANPAVVSAVVGIAITQVDIINTGGAIVDYVISPTIDNASGLSFNSTTGAISGTPMVTMSVRYEITASNSVGSDTATVDITVLANPTTIPNITANPALVNTTVGLTITPIIVTNTGGAANYTISPTLPNGLNFNTATGAITGRATAASSDTYTITAMNNVGNDSVDVVIVVVQAVTAAAPDINDLQAQVYTQDEPINQLIFINSGGAATSCRATLPAGLVVNEDNGNCVITGTPNSLGTGTYTITADNGVGGIDTARVQITVVAAAVAAPIIAISESSITVPVGSFITPVTITNTGGAVDRYSIFPGIVNGLSFDSNTGTISGRPTEVATVRDYYIVAINGTDTVGVDFSITVVAPAPDAPNITVNPTSVVTTAGTTINPIIVTNNGGAASYTISPPLPNGLNFDTATGAITGRPTAASSNVYTITAMNITGDDSVIVIIVVGAVTAAAPDINDLAAITYTVDQLISPLTFMNSGGAATSCRATLPAGLVVNEDNGNCVITGTPNFVGSNTYTIIADNGVGGIDTGTVQITVVASAVAAPIIAISESSITVPVGSFITPVTIANTGGAVDRYSIFPDIVNGLSFDSDTGTISGRPTAAAMVMNYYVVAINGTDTVGVNFAITVLAPVPAAPDINDLQAQIYTVDQLIIPLPFVNNGGDATSCTAALPAGLMVDDVNGTCVITGTPNTPSSIRTYTVRAFNSNDNDTAMVNITVNDIRPALVNENVFQTYIKDTLITTPYSFTNNGGAVVQTSGGCSSSPTLPSGLTLSVVNNTCQIAGTPTVVVSSAAQYVITGRNTGGNDIATIIIRVNDKAPIINSAAAEIYTKDTRIATVNFANTGGAVGTNGCTVSPALPTGLFVSVNSDPIIGCQITGTPSAVTAQRNYIITAANITNNTDTASISITVIDVVPTLPVINDLAAVTYTVGQPPTTLTFTNGGVDAVSCEVTPDLPTGLSVASSNGDCVITASPFEAALANFYTITAITAGNARDTARVNITVNDMRPALANETAAQTYTKDTLITTPYSFTNNGGAVVQTSGGCSSSPILPNGLTLSVVNSTCQIAGTPTVVVNPAAQYIITGRNTGGNDIALIFIGVNDKNPIIDNADAKTYTKDSGIATVNFANTGGAVRTNGCTVSPALPTGLFVSVNSDTIKGCQITGTPSAVTAQRNYLITATNITNNADTAAISITVIDVAPTLPVINDLAAVTYTVGQLNTRLIFINGGVDAVSCEVTPPLPNALSVSALNGDCLITGNPLEVAVANFYSVTAITAGNARDTARVNITVNDMRPALVNAAAVQTYTKDTLITTPYSFTNNGGAVVQNSGGCSSNPTLPSGLTLSVVNNTCQIAGTPTVVVSSAAQYVITGRNTAGNDIATIIIRVNDKAPIIDNADAETYTKDTGIATVNFANTGGAVRTNGCTVSPALPTGLSVSVNSDTIKGCQISGTPSAVTAQRNYLITATNITNNADTAAISITVIDVAPTLPVINNLAAVTYTVGQLNTRLTFTNGGVDAVSCEVTPPLPNALSVSALNGDCLITGNPLEVALANFYTVTAITAGNASDTARVNIAVNDIRPALANENVFQTYTKDTLITAPYSFVNSGGAVVQSSGGCSSNPALPSGLTLSVVNNTCQIAGTPIVVVSSAAQYIITGSNTGGNDIATIIIRVNDKAPIIDNADAKTYTKDTGISTVNFANTGGAVRTNGCTVSPALPTGLSVSVNSDTIKGCQITGTPSVVTAQRNYLITAANITSNTDTASISITVIDVAPALPVINDLAAVTYTVGQLNTRLTFTNGGVDAVSCAVTPPLPNALSVSALNGDCLITGNPLELAVANFYTVTAITAGNARDTARVNIAVNDIRPALANENAAQTYTKDTLITAPYSFVNSGGAVVQTSGGCSSSPTLPSGLTLSVVNNTCQIAGTPTVVVSSAAQYVITGRNTGGNDIATIIIRVNDKAPIINSAAAETYTKDSGIATVNFANTGGAVRTNGCTVAPALPTGLSVSVNSDTIKGCQISGTPSAVTAQRNYLITATNITNNADTAAISITVIDVAPTLPVINDLAAVTYTVGQLNTRLTFTNGGVDAVSCAVTPPLPNALSVSALNGDCLITGNPLEVALANFYTVTAITAGNARDTARVNIAVNDIRPALANENVFQTYTKDTLITTPYSFTNNGGAVVQTSGGCSSSPILPNGLTLSVVNSTCQIAGTPTVVVNPAAQYIITGRNTGGNDIALIFIGVNDKNPIIDNADAKTYTKDSGIATVNFANTGGAVRTNGCTVSPALPTGLFVSVNSDTIKGCQITGTPSAVTAQRNYLITATNITNNADTAAISITVIDVAPTLPVINDLAAVTYTVGQLNTRLIFINGGVDAVSCEVTPPLPNALSVSALNGDCLITGNPLEVAVANFYSVTAITAGNARDTARVNITVNDMRPALVNAAAVQTYTKDTLITTPYSFTNNGGAVVQNSGGCSSNPTLPSGLTLSVVNNTCQIAGTPTVVVSSAAQYVITGRNTAGNDIATIIIRVNDKAPIIDNADAETYTKDTGIATVNFANTGGAVRTNGCTVSPALPTGLSVSVNSDTIKGCQISGTPSAVTAQRNYLITATNITNNADTAAISITVIDVAPTLPVINNLAAVTYTVGQLNTRLTFTNGGVDAVSCEVTPPLPNALSVSALNGDCLITGNPLEVALANFYTVTAITAGNASDTARVNIAVNDIRPALANENVFQTYTKDTLITAPYSFVNSGGAVVQSSGGCSSNPALPSGLTLSVVNNTCQIAGTPIVVVSSAAQYIITGSNTGGNDIATIIIRVNDKAPIIDNADAKTYTKDTGISTVNFANTGGAVRTNGCTVSPALPTGLSVSVNSDTIKGCQITGTPSVVTAQRNYLITAANITSNTDTASISITVIDVAPALPVINDLAAVTYTVGQLNTRLTFTNGGVDAVSCAVTPPLPNALSVSALNGDCLITGNPLELAVANFYTVTAITAGNARDTARVNIAVNDIRPALANENAAQTYTKDTLITAPYSFVNSGGAVVQSSGGCSSNPALPSGLTLSIVNNTCQIAGTPTVVVSSAAQYVITASNTGGNDIATIIIRVNDKAPIIDNADAKTYTKDSGIATVNFANTGGAVRTNGCTVSPALPTGLSVSVNSDTIKGCQISGTPSVVTAQRNYIITAANITSNTDSAAISITVIDVAPALPVINDLAAVTYTVGQLNTRLTFTNGGVDAVSCAVTPPLPNALSVSALNGNCLITGNPLEVAFANFYTVTAITAGNTRDMARVNIAVNDIRPALANENAFQTYTKDTLITTPYSFVNSGGAVVQTSGGCSSNPILPSGLTLSVVNNTCQIAGTPIVVVSSTAQYVITASNTGGNDIATIIIRVNDKAPIIDNADAETYTKDSGIATVNFANTGGAVRTNGCTVAPALPTGLSVSVNSDTIKGCQISGTPSAVTAQRNYLITATNITNNADTAAISITVIDVAPTLPVINDLAAVTYTVGQLNTRLTFTNSGVDAVSCEVSQPLPNALSVSALNGDCVITGNPLEVVFARFYAVTAITAGNTRDTAGVNIRINDISPALADENVAQTYIKDTLITTPYSFTNSGGAVVQSSGGCSSNPILPSGLTLSIVNNTCQIAGTPIVVVNPAAPYVITSRNSGGNDAATIIIRVNDKAPIIDNADAKTYTKDTGIATVNFANTGGAVRTNGCTVSPALPTGLFVSVNSDTIKGCQITGTPSAVTAQRNYLITATNITSNTDTAAISITVIDVAPTLPIINDLAAVTYNAGQQPATTLTFVNSGVDAVSCEVTPDLPTGLSVASSNGDCVIIVNSFVRVAVARFYTVTAITAGNDRDTARVNITINDVRPALANENVFQTYTKDTLITAPYSFTNSGGAVVQSSGGCSSNPTLPSGLTLSVVNNTCQIAGTPTVVVSSAAQYVITGSNTGGNDSATITIRVNDKAPIIDNADAEIYTKDTGIATVNFANTGGAVRTGGCTVSPALPTGLSVSVNSDTIKGCQITGTPSAVTAQRNYLITATNITNNADTASISITVIDVAPALPVINDLAAVTYTVGQLNTTLTFVNGGVGAVSCAVTPPLPNALSVSALNGNCLITGNPLEVAFANFYTVTAITAGNASDTARVNITVNDIIPALVNGNVDQTYIKDTLITTPYSFTNNGGAVVQTSGGCISSPPLPSGLTLSVVNNTCQIAGTPTVIINPPVPYVIISSNTGGDDAAAITIGVNDKAPIIDNADAETYTKDSGIATVNFANTGGAVRTNGCTVSPALPTGLSVSVNSDTIIGCQITGTPSAVTAQRNYLITATNITNNADTASISITVIDVAPALPVINDLAAVTYTVGQLNTTLTFVNGGVGAVSCAVTPPLPNALSVSALNGNCLITGNPLEVAFANFYTVTAITAGNASDTARVNITVNDIIPALVNGNVDQTYIKDTLITTPYSFTNNGGAVVQTSGGCISSPPLPSGLTLSVVNNTCQIAGTPTVIINPPVPYVIISSNTGGDDAAAITIGVNDKAPIIDNADAETYTKDSGIATVNFANTGGAVRTNGCTVSPALPTGLSVSVNSDTIIGCQITGTPSAVTAQRNYLITATNITNNADTASISITVIDVAPTLPIIEDQAAVTYTVGQLNTRITFTNSGVDAVSCEVSQPLPNALSVSALNGDCVIIGNPLEAAVADFYTVTAITAANATDTARVNITVINGAPTSPVINDGS